MNVALDTNRLTDLFRGDAELGALLGGCDQVVIPFVVLAEMKAGFLAATRSAANERLLASLIAGPACRPSGKTQE